ncbi:MAG: OmpH family outer membrane protein [Flavobacteriaceae bacterium]|nr:OmpH family outer membrane protein [Psychroflexus sp.]
MRKLLFSAIIAASVMSCQTETLKTAYVDNSRLVQEYHKMETTEAKFEKKNEALSDELDAVAQEFQKEVQEFQEKASAMNKADLDKKQNELMQKQQMLQQQQQEKSSELRKESDDAINAIIDDVKEYVSNYGKDEGYTYIFGSNESANIMYAEEGLDITDEVLKSLNAEDSLK